MARRAAAQRSGRPARRPHAARQGPDRHCRDPHDVRLARLRRPRADPERDRRRPRARRRGRDRRQGEPRSSSPGACSDRTSGTARCTTRRARAAPPAARRAETQPRSRRASCELGIGTDTGCSVRLPAAACEVVGLKTQLGPRSRSTVSSRSCRSFDTVGPMARIGGRRRAPLVGAGRARGPRAAARRAHRRSAAPGAGARRRTRDRASDAAEAWVGDLEGLGARVVEAGVPDAAGEHLAACSSTRRCARTPRPSRPARTSTATVMRAKLEAATARGRTTIDGRVPGARWSGGSTCRRSTSTSPRASRSTCRRRTPTSSTSACRCRRSFAG